MPRVHELKTWPEPFGAVWMGLKRAEFRRDDRGFSEEDELRLREWDPETGEYTGRELLAVVTHICAGGQFGIPEGYVMMSIICLKPGPSSAITRATGQ